MADAKGWGFPVTRKRGSQRRRSWRSVSWLVWPVVLAVLLLIAGATPLWPQNSGLSSSSSADTLTSWNELYEQGRTIYERQNGDLEALRKEIETLKDGSGKLTLLSGQLSKSNDDLRRYNAQIAARMQERDEELVAAYNVLDRLEKQRLKFIIALIVMGVIIAGLSIIIIRR